MPALRFVCILAFMIFFTTCKNSGKTSPGNSNPSLDTLSAEQQGTNKTQGAVNADTTLTIARSFLENELSKWVKSFNGYHPDSFHFSQTSPFSQTDYNAEMDTDMDKFYSLYRPSLSYSPDSAWFIDLYSAGIYLEKKGKKIIATGDVDMAVTLYDLKNHQWSRIASFGPSANIEEAVWISGSKFILAGTMQGDNGESMPIILIGDTGKKSFSWFESTLIRPESVKYDPSGLTKLKIDEWE